LQKKSENFSEDWRIKAHDGAKLRNLLIVNCSFLYLYFFFPICEDIWTQYT
jgi:hypothetical protein